MYVNNLVGNVKANPRDFYRYINSQKKDNQGIPPLKRRGGTGITASEIEQAEEFNGQFTDVFNKSDHIEVPFLSRSAPFMDDIVVSNEGVTKLLKGLNPSKALGPDELHPRVLKELATELAHLDEYKLLSDRQYVFRKRHSCETQLTTIINDWAKILDNGGQVDTFILDFEKAFDTPPHELLKSKLFGCGIGGKTLKWIDSFLCDRQQRVVVNGAKPD